ncbi:MAG: putative lipid II flippase FtsW [Elusimicrobiaceae bacterium]|nr:putative lipid II flippase FtsW [Elusimicrobiaceae bacterium]
MTNIFLEKDTLKTKRNLSNKKTLPKLDKTLLIITAILIVLGLVFIYSSSAFDTIGFFKKQIFFDILGLIIMWVLARYYMNLQKLIKPNIILFISWGLLIWALFSSEAAHVHRWVRLGPINIQPSEFAKLALIIFLSYSLSRKQDIATNSKSLIIPFIYALITILLVVMGKDLGIPALMFSVSVMIFFIAGTRLKYIAGVFLLAIPAIVIECLRHPYRIQRIATFLEPEKTIGDAGYQLSHTMYAIGSGGWFGKGLGASELKLEFLPAAHTDFIFAIFCEEVGMVGAFILIALFIWLLARGLTIARTTDNKFNSYLASGITLCLCLQAFINMGVAGGLFPTKGLPLPFFSYGGSSVIITLAMMGILMNIAGQGNKRDILPRIK